jgi:hypothetical protein
MAHEHGPTNPTPHNLHLTLCTLHPTPCAPHPAPCTLHPTPYTLHPTPYALRPTLSTCRFLREKAHDGVLDGLEYTLVLKRGSWGPEHAVLAPEDKDMVDVGRWPAPQAVSQAEFKLEDINRSEPPPHALNPKPETRKPSTSPGRLCLVFSVSRNDPVCMLCSFLLLVTACGR